MPPRRAGRPSSSAPATSSRAYRGRPRPDRAWRVPRERRQRSRAESMCSIRPELLELAPDPAGAGEVVTREFRGHDVFYRVRLDGPSWCPIGPPRKSLPSALASRSASTRAACPCSTVRLSAGACKVRLTSMLRQTLHGGTRVKALAGLAALARGAAAAGCGGGSDDTLTVYSGREEELVAPLFERSRTRPGSTSRCDTATAPNWRPRSPRRATTRRPTSSSPRTRARSARSSAQLPSCRRGRLDRVDERFRDEDGRWVGTSGRSASSSTTPTSSPKRAARIRLRPHRPEMEGQDRHRADERLLPGFRHRDAAVRRRRADAAVARGPEAERPEDLREATRRSSRRSPRARSTSGS